MTIKDLYQSIVNDMTELDKSIEYLKGKREALNSIRLDLRSMIDEDLGEKVLDFGFYADNATFYGMLFPIHSII